MATGAEGGGGKVCVLEEEEEDDGGRGRHAQSLETSSDLTLRSLFSELRWRP